jgi:hypothetical protein
MNYLLHDDVDRLATVEDWAVVDSSDEKAGVTAINDRTRSVRNKANVPSGQRSGIDTACDRHTVVACHGDSPRTRDGCAIITGHCDATAACNRCAIFTRHRNAASTRDCCAVFARDSDPTPVCGGDAIVSGDRSTAPRHRAGTVFARPGHAAWSGHGGTTTAADSVGPAALGVAGAEKEGCARKQDQGMKSNGRVHGSRCASCFWLRRSFPGMPSFWWSTPRSSSRLSAE